MGGASVDTIHLICCNLITDMSRCYLAVKQSDVNINKCNKSDCSFITVSPAVLIRVKTPHLSLQFCQSLTRLSGVSI